MRVFPLTLLVGLLATSLVLAESPSDKKLISTLKKLEVPGASGVSFTDVRDLHPEEDSPGLVLFKAKDSAGRWGWYWWNEGAVKTVLRTGDTSLAGETKPVEFVGGASRSGKFALIEAEANGVRVLVLANGEEDTSRVLLWADGGVKVPGHKKDFILYISPEPVLGSRDIVFGVARVESPHLKDSQTRGDRAICGWFDVNLDDPKALDPTKLVTVADWKSTVPDEPGGQFIKFDRVRLADGEVAFEGSGEGFEGSFRFDPRSKKAVLRSVSAADSDE